MKSLLYKSFDFISYGIGFISDLLVGISSYLPIVIFLANFQAYDCLPHHIIDPLELREQIRRQEYPIPNGIVVEIPKSIFGVL